MSIVLDASVLTALLTSTGSNGTWCEDVVKADSLCAPELLLVETTNVLRHLVLAKKISDLEASTAHSDLKRLDVELFPYSPFADRIWALRASITSYDAWYVALAEATNTPLATLDIRLVRANGPECEFMIPDFAPDTPTH